jgi:hypothetical protein
MDRDELDTFSRTLQDLSWEGLMECWQLEVTEEDARREAVQVGAKARLGLLALAVLKPAGPTATVAQSKADQYEQEKRGRRALRRLAKSIDFIGDPYPLAEYAAIMSTY